MPIVKIDMWEKRLDANQKEKLIKKVSDSISDVTGASLDAIEVIINEIPKENWGKGGVAATRWEK